MRQEAERVVRGPEPMVNIPKMAYVVIKNPHVRDPDNANHEPVLDEHGQIRLQHGEKEIRFSEQWPDPFPLYPGEECEGEIEKLQFIGKNEALKLTANQSFEEIVEVSVEEEEKDGTKKIITKTEVIPRVAGDEWLFVGPQMYLPR